ncbi:MAG TPA: hypothetical protein VEY12_05450 [Thermoplasmata archaeon]|nr:hypothetical protein [Thermoplasmata archaeon]
MTEVGYSSISLPTDLWQRVQRLAGVTGLGYSSPTELVKEAVRQKCEELESKAGRRAR